MINEATNATAPLAKMAGCAHLYRMIPFPVLVRHPFPVARVTSAMTHASQTHAYTLERASKTRERQVVSNAAAKVAS